MDVRQQTRGILVGAGCKCHEMAADTNWPSISAEASCLNLTVPCYALDSTSGMGVGPQIRDLKGRSLWEFLKKQQAHLQLLKA
jgi:hypothetical protein